MSKNLKKNLVFLFFLLAGIVLGSFIADICQGVKYLDWLSWGKSIGFPKTDNAAVFDLIVFKIAFGFQLQVTISQIITVILSVLLFTRVSKRL